MCYMFFYYTTFHLPSDIADESNQTFIRHDDAVLLQERMHSEHKPPTAFVIKIQPKNLDS